MSEGPTPLGIDNVVFDVADLGAAVAFYENCGFRLKIRIDAKAIALFAIGNETPGLMLVARSGGTGRLWIEVADAEAAARTLRTRGLQTRMIETATGLTCEVEDPSGNIIGFADYSRRPDLARSR